MQKPVCEFIDLLPHLVPALVLGAKAGLLVHRENREEAFAEIDGHLTPSQLMDLASWSKSYAAQPIESSPAHNVFWEAGVTLQARIHAEAGAEVGWKWVEANVAGEYEYFTRMAIVRVGASFVLLTSEVYRCAASDLHQRRSIGSWNELDDLEVGNYFNAARRAAELLLELGDVEALILKRNGSQASAD
ncbi:hypothetical protein NJG16_01270 [Stenotrophomonas maltophilia]|uniref:hypothetical protein n=1 Tax=Stenotrophomonas lactitubi TaxID=2045214 RepID=UPI00203BC834|nr:hypothetical protein [Stenotrophomonas lactitubi]MCO7468696.1 hypothetical protein [Stenotrophomonas maltophilia]